MIKLSGPFIAFILLHTFIHQLFRSTTHPIQQTFIECLLTVKNPREAIRFSENRSFVQENEGVKVNYIVGCLCKVK